MTPSLLATTALLALSGALAQEEEAPVEEVDLEPVADDGLEPYRQRFDVLADRAIGTTSTPVEFNWRSTTVQLGASGSFLVELNNFNSARVGGLARLPTGGLLLEFGLNYAHVWDTPSSELLALTPYRQPGRPNRLEVDFAVGVPLAEGVVTTAPRFFPAVQLVFNGYAGIRYSLYPTGWGGMRPGQVGGAILAPALTTIELDNLADDERLDAMLVDPGRYGLLLGFGNDIYLKQGFFVSPRFLFAVPLLAPASQTNLLFWADFSVAAGMAF